MAGVVVFSQAASCLLPHVNVRFQLRSSKSKRDPAGARDALA